MMVSSNQFHACNAWVYAYDKPRMHEFFHSYKTEVCISAFRKEDGRDVLLVWLHPRATSLSRTTTKQLCRYLGERIHHYVSDAVPYGNKPYMPVAHVRMLVTCGMIGDDNGVYARYMGTLRDYSGKTLECAVDGR